MEVPNPNRRHKAVLLLTAIVTGLALLKGLAIGQGLGIALLGVAMAWVVGSSGFLTVEARVRKRSKAWGANAREDWKDFKDPAQHFDALAFALCVFLAVGGLIAILSGLDPTNKKEGLESIALGVLAVIAIFPIYRKSQSWRPSKKK